MHIEQALTWDALATACLTAADDAALGDRWQPGAVRQRGQVPVEEHLEDQVGAARRVSLPLHDVLAAAGAGHGRVRQQG